MEPVALILSAAAAGASELAKGALSEAGKDIYLTLTGAIRRKDPEFPVEKIENSPSTVISDESLAGRILLRDIYKDEEVIALSQNLLEELRQSASSRIDDNSLTIMGSVNTVAVSGGIAISRNAGTVEISSERTLSQKLKRYQPNFPVANSTAEIGFPPQIFGIPLGIVIIYTMMAWLEGTHPASGTVPAVIFIIAGVCLVLYGLIGSIIFWRSKTRPLIAGIVSVSDSNVTLETIDGSRKRYTPTNRVHQFICEGEIGVAYIRNGYLTRFKKDT